MDNTRSFQWGGATITVRRAKVRDRMTTDAIQTKIAPDSADITEKVQARYYGQMCAQSTVEGDVEGLGFPLLSASASEKELRDAFEQYLDADDELAVAWRKEIEAVNARVMPTDKPNPKDAAASQDSTQKA